MRGVQLDFAPQPQRFRILGMLLLAAGVVSCAWTGDAYLQAKAELEELTAQSAALQAQLNKKPLKENLAPLASEFASANKSVEQLSLPWDKLFSAVEMSINDDITLLGLSPNTGDGILTIKAEARTKNAMLDYIRRLRSSPMLQNAYLGSHEIQSPGADRPVRFVVEARWLRK